MRSFRTRFLPRFRRPRRHNDQPSSCVLTSFSNLFSSVVNIVYSGIQRRSTLPDSAPYSLQRLNIRTGVHAVQMVESVEKLIKCNTNHR